MLAQVTLQSLALEAYGYFETARRATGDTATGPCEDGETYDRVKDGAPEWVSELVYAAHGSDFLPDDWRYSSIRSTLEFISESGDPEDEGSEWADSNVDIYNGARLAWLASNLRRPAYCDEGAAEFGGEDLDMLERVGLGQYAESYEVYGLVLRALGERLEALEDDEGES